MAIDRPPRPSEHHQEIYDGPGDWLFFGTIRVNTGSEIVTVTIRDPLPFCVIQQPLGLEVTEPIDSSVYHGVEWFGWWVKQEER